MESTGGDDPRTLDTLAAALEATGRTAEAGAIRTAAIARARARGETALASAIASQMRPSR